MLAIDLAQWISLDFRAQVAIWLENARVGAVESKIAPGRDLSDPREQLALKKGEIAVKREELDYIKDVHNFFKEIGLDDDDRTKSLLQSSMLNYLTETKVVGAPVEISVSLRVQDKYKLVLTSVELQSIGKKLAKKCRELRGDNSIPKKLQVVNGANRRVNYYTVEDWEEFGDDVLFIALKEMGKFPRAQMTQSKLNLVRK